MSIFCYSDHDLCESSTSWTDGSSALSKFDQAVRSSWDQADEDGLFRYKLNITGTKIIGKKNYVAQLNVLRATERRKPQATLCLNQPFNPDHFNFTKIKKEEILLELQYKPGADGEVANGVCNGREEGDNLKVGISVISSPGAKLQERKDVVIINDSPLEYGHVLILPDIYACRPQVLSEECIGLGIKCLLLSQHRGFRVGFNSLCAFASVNHQHLHAYYLEKEIFVESCAVSHLHGILYEINNMPVKGFAVQLHGTTVSEVSRLLFHITNYFQEKEVAHNLFMTRGTVFGEPSHSTKRTVRIFLWPRKPFVGIKFEAAFNVALVELAGHLPIKMEELWDSLDEEKIEQTIAEWALSETDYNKIKDDILKMITEDAH